MAEPKKKLSKTRSNRKRSLYKKRLQDNIVTCSNCGEFKLTHQICSKCGFYKGVSIKQLAPTKRILVDEKKEEKKENVG